MLRHRLMLSRLIAVSTLVAAMGCGDDDPPPPQAVVWFGFSPAQGATCSSGRNYQLPEDARNTISGSSGAGDRIPDGGGDLVECTVSPSAAGDGSFDVDLRFASEEAGIGTFSVEGVLAEGGGGEVEVSFVTSQFSLQDETCAATVETLISGAVWIDALNCESMRDDRSPSVECVGNGGVIFENCSR